MRRETWLADRIEASVSGLFTTHHVLSTPAGVLGRLTMAPLRRRDVFRGIDGRELVMERTSWWRGTHELREEEIVLATARPRGAFRRTLAVAFNGQPYTLMAVGFWGRTWQLIDGAGRGLVEVRPRGAFRRGAILRVLNPVDVDLLAFVYYLVTVRWQEQAAAGGAAAAASS